jgi:predicted nucleic acid-binding protein
LKEAVVDASVAAKWVVKEAHSAAAARLPGYDALCAPAHWRAEAVNVLWAKVFKGDLTAADATERMQVLNRAPVIDAAISTLMPGAFAISAAQAVTIYDSLYLALAEQRDVEMITADEKLISRLSAEPAVTQRILWVGDLAP